MQVRITVGTDNVIVTLANASDYAGSSMRYGYIKGTNGNICSSANAIADVIPAATYVVNAMYVAKN